MPMSQAEIDDISISFLDAWNEYFGMPAYYCKSLPRNPKYQLYDEEPNPQPFTFIGPMPASKIENPTLLQLEEFGLSEESTAIFTFVTKSLVDNGITSINNRDIVKTDENGGTLYEVTSYSRTTQFVSTFIFTALGVRDYVG